MELTWDTLGDEIIKKASDKGVPVIGQFELTPRCNLKCKMCYICRPANDGNTIANEHSAEEWIRMAMEARDAGTLYLLLTGGEVFLRNDFKEIYNEISMMGFSTEIYTNATMITPQLAKWIGTKPPARIGVTLYGASTETYFRVCGNAEGFKNAVQGIDMLLEEGIKLELKTTVIRENAGDYELLEEFAEKRGLGLSIVNYISPMSQNRGIFPVEERLGPTKLAEFENIVRMHLKKKAGYYHNETQEEIIKEKPSDSLRIKEMQEYKEDSDNCSAGKCAYWITWDGRMTSCGFMDKPVTHPFKRGFVTAWEDLKKQAALITLCEECSRCGLKKYCKPCPAILQSESGLLDRSAPYLCQLAQERERLEKASKIE